MDRVQTLQRLSAEGKIAEVLARCEGAFSDNTLRGYRADLAIFEAWCCARGATALPAAPETVAAFVDAQSPDLAATSLKRRLAAIGFAHRYSDLPIPTTASVVMLAVRRAQRRKAIRPEQATGLTVDVLDKILRTPATSLAQMRDAALIAVGYDTLCRSAELAALRLEHLRLGPQRDAGLREARGAALGDPAALGDASVLIARSKADREGDGRIAWLSPRTVAALRRWLDAADIREGWVFRALNTRRVSDAPLDTCSIRRLVKRAALAAGVDPAAARKLSGHSMRVGAAQDMLAAGFDALTIMQAGGWKTTDVLLRYVENAQTRELHRRRWEVLGRGR